MPKRLTLFAPVLLAVVLSIGIMAWFGYHNAKDILEQELVAHPVSYTHLTLPTRTVV